MTTEYVTPAAATRNGSDRPPSKTTVKRIEAAKRRRERALMALKAALGTRPRGCTSGTLERAERVSRLLDEYQTASAAILSEELL
jgi:hypothetical protein